MSKGYDRYAKFRKDDDVNLVPSLTIPRSQEDIYIIYDREVHRFDNLSYKYYNDANFGWLILMANPEHGSLEFRIKNGTHIRVPYPLSSAISRYENEADKWLNANLSR